GFTPDHTFKDGLEKTVHWMLENVGWWRAIQDQSYRDWINSQYTTDQA
ncbi:MAG: dTDP-glucose 4,6-dehydratase, partial [Rhodobacteraceae bacterium]|nr:dTDP-glucose 4,6-dehydratase [Paracoccaceae bacterium]